MTLPLPAFAVMEDVDVAIREATDYLGLLEEIVGRSADEVEMLERIRELPDGALGALGLIAFGIPATFRPDQAAGETGSVVFVLNFEGQEIQLCIEILPGECRVVETVEDAAAVIRISLPVFLRIAFKFIDGNDAYLGGLTDVTGDVFLATNLDQWFELPSAAISRLLADSPNGA